MKKHIYILKKIASEDVMKALEEIDKNLSNESQVYNTFLTLKSEAQRLKTSTIHGILSYTELSIETNKILLRTLEFIDSIYQERHINIDNRKIDLDNKKLSEAKEPNFKSDFINEWWEILKDLENFINEGYQIVKSFQKTDDLLIDFIDNENYRINLEVSREEYYNKMLSKATLEVDKLEEKMKYQIVNLYPKFNACFEYLENGLGYIQNEVNSIGFWDKWIFYKPFKVSINGLYRDLNKSIPSIKELEKIVENLELNYINKNYDKKGLEFKSKIEAIGGEEEYFEYYEKKIKFYKITLEFGDTFKYMLKSFTPIVVNADIIFKKHKI